MWILSAVLAAACAGPAPAPFHYDSDACDHCRMTISDPSFAAQLVTNTRRNYRFDDPGCLAAFLAAQRVAAADVHAIWANDHAHPEQRLRVEAAVFVVSDRIRAPMNGHMAAFGVREDAVTFQASVGGRVLSWAEATTAAVP